MIEVILDHLLQLLLYLLRIPLLNFLERFICNLFKKSESVVLDVLHKSDDFIIVNKPFDVLINSDNPNVKPTLQTLLRDTYPELANTELFHEFHFVNRLDYSTSGVICIALNKKSCTEAVKVFENRKADKYYLALLRGHLENEFVNVEEGIGEDKRHKGDSHKMCVASNENCDLPRDASTDILLLERGFYDGKEASKVLIKPYTGRRHQIRVHCQFIGHPVVGDYTYGNDEDKETYRMFLHSHRLVLPNNVEALDIQSKKITTGTEFVYACELEVAQLLEDMRAEGCATWSSEYLSSSIEPGEGEVKISQYVRRLWQADVQSGCYSPDDVISIVGNDSDLIIVSMVATPYRYCTVIDPGDCRLTCLKELMDHWCRAVPNPPLPEDLLPSYRIDFSFLMLLAGCDYYDGIGETAVHLWRTYRRLRADGGFFNRRLISGERCELDTEFLRRIVQRDGPHIGLVRVSKNKKKSAKAALRSRDAESASDGTSLLRAALWNLKGYIYGQCVDYGFAVPTSVKRPSVCSIRSAAQLSGIARLIHLTGGLRYEEAKQGADVRQGSGQEHAEKDVKMCGAVAQSAHPLTALEQCVAILGVRGRYSKELRMSLEHCTDDGGMSITTKSSASYLITAVKQVMGHVNIQRLTKTEQLLHTFPPTATHTGDGVFMTIGRGSKRLNSTKGNNLKVAADAPEENGC